MSTGMVENEVDDSTGVEDDLNSEVDETTGVEDDLNSAVDNDTDDELVEDDDSLEDIRPTTESHKFQQAVSDGISRALEGNGQRPRRRHTKKVKDPGFEYINLIFKDIEPRTVFTMLMEQNSTEMLSFMTEQMSAKRRCDHEGIEPACIQKGDGRAPVW